MTDNEIIKALECCNSPFSEYRCCDCPLYDTDNCEKALRIVSIDLINRQQAEIERLQKVKEQIKKEKNKILDAQMFLAKTCDDLEEKLKTAKAEAIKEFAESLNNETFKVDYAGSICNVVDIDDIDNLVKEMERK